MAVDDKPDINSLLFTQLVMSFQAAALQHMGRAPDPFSGKNEKKMEAAKNAIDILGMLEAKTAGNLSEPELKFLQQTLTQLRMLFVEEADRPGSDEKKPD